MSDLSAALKSNVLSGTAPEQFQFAAGEAVRPRVRELHGVAIEGACWAPQVVSANRLNT